MRNPGGFAQIISPGDDTVRLDGFQCHEIRAGTTEMETYGCFHCNSIVHVMPRMDPANLGGLCKQCMRLICPRCLDKGCVPFEKKLEIQEKRDIALRSYGLGS